MRKQKRRGVEVLYVKGLGRITIYGTPEEIRVAKESWMKNFQGKGEKR